MVLDFNELGLVVAENNDEELWFRVHEQTTKIISQLEDDLKINKAMQELAKSKCPTKLKQS